MVDYNTSLQTVAAISSAIAAVAAAVVAKKTFIFQRNVLLKKASIDQILELLHGLHYLKSLTGQSVIGATDDAVVGIKQRIREITEGAIVLESMVSTHSGANVKKVVDVVCSLGEERIFACEDCSPNMAVRGQLDDAISALMSIYHVEVKRV